MTTTKPEHARVQAIRLLEKQLDYEVRWGVFGDESLDRNTQHCRFAAWLTHFRARRSNATRLNNRVSVQGSQYRHRHAAWLATFDGQDALQGNPPLAGNRARYVEGSVRYDPYGHWPDSGGPPFRHTSVAKAQAYLEKSDKAAEERIPWIIAVRAKREAFQVTIDKAKKAKSLKDEKTFADRASSPIRTEGQKEALEE